MAASVALDGLGSSHSPRLQVWTTCCTSGLCPLGLYSVLDGRLRGQFPLGSGAPSGACPPPFSAAPGSLRAPGLALRALPERPTQKGVGKRPLNGGLAAARRCALRGRWGVPFASPPRGSSHRPGRNATGWGRCALLVRIAPRSSPGTALRRVGAPACLSAGGRRPAPTPPGGGSALRPGKTPASMGRLCLDSLGKTLPATLSWTSPQSRI